jgi:hypothetical protein
LEVKLAGSRVWVLLYSTLSTRQSLLTTTHEINPLVLGSGPILFVAGKLLCSLAIVLFARSTPNPSRGRCILSSALAFILAWNESTCVVQLTHAQSLAQALFWGSSASVALAFATLMALAFRRGRFAL